MCAESISLHGSYQKSPGYQNYGQGNPGTYLPLDVSFEGCSNTKDTTVYTSYTPIGQQDQVLHMER